MLVYTQRSQDYYCVGRIEAAKDCQEAVACYDYRQDISRVSQQGDILTLAAIHASRATVVASRRSRIEDMREPRSMANSLPGFSGACTPLGITPICTTSDKARFHATRARRWRFCFMFRHRHCCLVLADAEYYFISQIHRVTHRFRRAIDCRRDANATHEQASRQLPR